MSYPEICGTKVKGYMSEIDGPLTIQAEKGDSGVPMNDVSAIPDNGFPDPLGVIIRDGKK